MKAVRVALFAAPVLAGVLSALPAGFAQTAVTPPQTPPAVPQQTPARGGPAQPPPPLVYTGLIIGRVIDSTTNQGVAGAIVTLNGGPGQTPAPRAPGTPPTPTFSFSPPRLLTDSEGRFAFRNLTRGQYTLTAEKNGYSGGAYGRSNVGRPGRALLMDDGERATDVTVRLFKFAAISGRVIDEAGEPVVGAMVRTFRRTWSAGRRVLTMSTSGVTDDRGMYRLFNLTAGELLVSVPMSSTSSPAAPLTTADARQNFSATSQGLTAPSPLLAGGRQVSPDGRFFWQSGMPAGNAPLIMDSAGRWRAFATQYYSAARTASAAQPVVLAAGDDRPGIDFVMPYVPTSSVSGMLFGPNGPAPNYVLRLVPSDSSEFTQELEVASAVTDSSGAFTFLAVPAGQYVIQTVKVPQGAPPPPPPPPPGSPAASAATGRGGSAQLSPTAEPLWWAVAPVSVGDGDVDGVNLTLREGLTVSGRLEFAGSKARPDASRLISVPIVLEPADGRESAQSSGAPSRVQPDGRFMTAGRMPGKYFVRVGGMPSGWLVQSITAGGVNALERPIELTSQDVSGVVIAFTDLIGGIRGTVRGIPPGADPPIVLQFPADIAGWKDFGINPWPQRRFSANATTGAFDLGQLTGGDYFVVAISAEFGSEWQNPAYLEELSRVAQRVTLGAGERRVLDISLSDVRPPGIGREPAPVSAPVASAGTTQDVQPDASPRDRGPAPVEDHAEERQGQPPRDTRTVEPVGTASVSGRVFQMDESLRPSRLAKVSVRGGGLTGERSVLTDDEGRFTVPWLPPGTYTVAVSKPAYLTQVFGSTGSAASGGTQLKLQPGQALTGIEVTILRGAVISGVVTDAMGLPVVNVRAQPLTYMMRDGDRILSNSGAQGGMTDDRGTYRIYGLRPGRYVLSVTPLSIGGDQDLRELTEADMRAALAEAAKGPSPAVTAGQPRTIPPAPPGTTLAPPAVGGKSVGYTPVYYPGALREQDATEITVTAAQELNGMNLQLQLVPTSRIGGVIIGPDGQPARAARVNLQRLGGVSSGAPSVRVSEGAFQAVGVAAGRYLLTAQLTVQAPPGSQTPGAPFQQTTHWAQQEIEVFGNDAMNLTLQLSPPFQISGRVVFEGGNPPEPKTLQVRLEQGGRPVGGFPMPRPISPDASGAFTITDVFPGRYRLSAIVTPQGSPPAPAAWTLESSAIDGQDVLIAPFDVRGDRALTSAVVKMTTKPAELSGTLVDGQNQPVERMVVAIFPTDPALWSMTTSRGIRSATTGADGAYRFPTLVPREYFLVVLTELDLTQWGQPAYMEQLAAAGLKLAIAPGEKKVQGLRVR